MFGDSPLISLQGTTHPYLTQSCSKCPGFPEPKSGHMPRLDFLFWESEFQGDCCKGRSDWGEFIPEEAFGRGSPLVLAIQTPESDFHLFYFIFFTSQVLPLSLHSVSLLLFFPDIHILSAYRRLSWSLLPVTKNPDGYSFSFLTALPHSRSWR